MPERPLDPLIDVAPAEEAHPHVVDADFLDRVFDARQVLSLLRSRPLLGPDRMAAHARIRFVASVLQELPDELASTDLLALAGDLALEAGHGEAVDRYLRGAENARRRADFVRERALHLRACRAVARFRGPAAAAGFFDELGAVDDEPCPIDYLLTLAEMDPQQARVHLQDALELLVEPTRAHTRLTALEDLAERLVRGSEPVLALQHLEEALALATEWADPGRIGQVHAQVAGIHLVAGRPDLARPPLRAALDGALADQDDLLVVLKAIGKVLWYNVKYLFLNFAPFVPLSIPFVIVVAQLVVRFGFAPIPVEEANLADLRPGQGVMIEVEFDEASKAKAAELEIVLPEGLAALSPLVRSAADGKAFQEVVAVADGAWDVELKVGGETETKRVLTGETTERIMQPFRVAGFWDLWLWPAEPSFSAASGLATVSVAYPDRELAWMMDGAGGVFIMFVIVAFIIGGAAIKVFDIQI